MFSGIVEAIGEVTDVTPVEGAVTFTIKAGELAAALTPGDSVSIDGACLTVESASSQDFCVTAVATTLQRTIANTYQRGSRVNLERALCIGARLDGHFVQGHVDGVGTLIDVDPVGADVRLRFRVPESVASTTLERGSIALNGVSLTVAEGPGGPDGTEVGIAVVPFTWSQTNLADLNAGDPVNVEADLIGKYVGRMVASSGIPRSAPQ